MLTWKGTGLCCLDSCIAKRLRGGGELEENNPKCCSTTQIKLEHLLMHLKLHKHHKSDLFLGLILPYLSCTLFAEVACMHYALCSVSVRSTCCIICCQSSRRSLSLLLSECSEMNPLWELWVTTVLQNSPSLFQLCKQADAKMTLNQWLHDE